MRVDQECSCGAKLTVSFEVHRVISSSNEHGEASRLLEQFRRDHKVCRTSRAATAAAKEGAVT